LEDAFCSILIFRGIRLHFRALPNFFTASRLGFQPAQSAQDGCVRVYTPESGAMTHFDDTMTAISALWAGNGPLLAAILKVHPGLRGNLADQPRVLPRAVQSSIRTLRE
jgi:hypothetical protein